MGRVFPNGACGGQGSSVWVQLCMPLFRRGFGSSCVCPFSFPISFLSCMALVVRADDPVSRQMAVWGLSPDMYEVAKDWYLTLATGSYYATALKVPFVYQGTSGMIVAVSMAASTRVCQENAQQRRMITTPHWLMYECWWFKGLALGSWAGITNSRYQGEPLAGNLGTLLHGMCMERGMAEWKRECCSIVQGFFMESLRLLLGALGIRNWFEITAGMSWRQYRALDLYVRVFSGVCVLRRKRPGIS